MFDETEPVKSTRGGCIHLTYPGGSPCRKVCDPGETMCPHHRLLFDAKMGEAARKAPKSVAVPLRTPKGYQA